VEWSQLEQSLLGRCARRFIELEGVDRALALASRAFVAVIPLAIVASAVTPAGESFGERLVERFDLEGEGAVALRRLFATPSDVRAAATAIGLVALLITCHSFARLLQRTYERIWRLEPAGRRALMQGLTWIGGLFVFIAVIAPLRVWLVDLGGLGVDVVVAVGTSTAFWAWTPYVLLGKRIAWRRLLPSAVLTALGGSILSAASLVWMPTAIERSAEAYGLIGVTFLFVSWLFSWGLVLVAAAVIGAEAAGPTEESGRPGGSG
jgi:membrane protein